MEGDPNPVEIECGTGTNYEIDDTFLLLEEHFTKPVESKEVIMDHLFRLSKINYIGDV